MVVHSNQDASNQQIYREDGSNAAGLIGGAAAIGGLAFLLTRGKGGKGVGASTDDVAKAADVVEPSAIDKAVNTKPVAPDSPPPSSTVYPNGQQGAVDQMVKAAQETTEGGVDRIKNKAARKQGVKDAAGENEFLDDAVTQIDKVDAPKSSQKESSATEKEKKVYATPQEEMEDLLNDFMGGIKTRGKGLLEKYKDLPEVRNVSLEDIDKQFEPAMNIFKDTIEQSKSMTLTSRDMDDFRNEVGRHKKYMDDMFDMIDQDFASSYSAPTTKL